MTSVLPWLLANSILQKPDKTVVLSVLPHELALIQISALGEQIHEYLESVSASVFGARLDFFIAKYHLLSL